MVLIVLAGKPSRILKYFELDMLVSCLQLYVYCVGISIMLFKGWDFFGFVLGMGDIMIRLGLHMGEFVLGVYRRVFKGL